MSAINNRKVKANKALAESTAFVLITMDKDHKQDIIIFTGSKEACLLHTGLCLAGEELLNYIKNCGMLSNTDKE